MQVDEFFAQCSYMYICVFVCVYVCGCGCVCVEGGEKRAWDVVSGRRWLETRRAYFKVLRFGRPRYYELLPVLSSFSFSFQSYYILFSIHLNTIQINK